MPAIQSITDERLIHAISRAAERVVLISPGIWPPVAKAVAEAWLRLGKDRVTVILDVDPEICRIGYGSLEGLEILQNAATQQEEAIGQEPGIRICVFIVDQETFVFSPTPRQLEAPPSESLTVTPATQGTPATDATPVAAPPPKANGIVLSRPPETLAAELGGGDEGIIQRKLGMEPLSQEKLINVTKDLAQNPPKNFDLSRAVNVYNAKIQFVELKVAGCRLSEHRARLPQQLVHVLRKNPDLSRKIENSIRLLDEEDALVTDKDLSQDTIFKRRDEIAENYLRPIRSVGTVIERSLKTDFLNDVKSLKAEVVKFATSVEANLSERFENTAQQLATELLDEVLADLPQRWRKKLGPRPDPERVRWLILEELLKAFGTPAGKVGKMKVEIVFKDVTYDMLNDADFQEQIAAHFPDLPVMEEFKAAKERPATTKATPKDLFS